MECDGTNICKQEGEGGKLKTTIVTIYEDGSNEIIDKNEYNLYCKCDDSTPHGIFLIIDKNKTKRKD